MARVPTPSQTPTPATFDAAVAVAKVEGNLSRANVVRKVKVRHLRPIMWNRTARGCLRDPRGRGRRTGQ